MNGLCNANRSRLCQKRLLRRECARALDSFPDCCGGAPRGRSCARRPQPWSGLWRLPTPVLQQRLLRRWRPRGCATHCRCCLTLYVQDERARCLVGRHLDCGKRAKAEEHPTTELRESAIIRTASDEWRDSDGDSETPSNVRASAAHTPRRSLHAHALPAGLLDCDEMRAYKEIAIKAY